MVAGIIRHIRDSDIATIKRNFTKQIVFSSALFLCGLFWVVFAAIGFSLGNMIDEPFQRSGSILVLVSIYLEYSYRESAIKEISLSLPRIPHDEAYRQMIHYLIAFAAKIRFFAILTAVIGTLIWGYGGLLSFA